MFEAMVDGAREGLCLLNPGSVMLRSNQVAGEILGFDPKRATGVPVHELGAERDFDWSIVGEGVAG
jgi:PAS domain-containing protein